MRATLSFLCMMMVMQLCKTQSISYNQYNAVLSAINPAYIANLEKDYVSVIGLDQWPGYAQSATMETFAFSKSADRINSGFGIMAHQLRYNGSSFARYGLGLQYAYKVVFLDALLLNFGVGLNLQEQNMVSDFCDRFSKNYTSSGLLASGSSKTLNGNYGIIVQPFSTDPWYIGLSMRNSELYRFTYKTPGIHQQPTFSLQLMRGQPITRNSSIYYFLNLEHNGKIAFDGLPETFGNKGFYTLFFQANYLSRDKYNVGIGYKYFTGRYGSLNYRIGYTTGNSNHHPGKGSKHRVTIGLSYDVKPYIQNDQVHSFSSYEIFFKYRIPTKN